MNGIPPYIREWRIKSQLTQEALAKKAGLSQEAISAIENGKGNITLHTLQKIAVALESPIPSLFERPSAFAQSLDRFHIDRTARSVVYGKPLPNRVVRDIAGLISQKLKVHKAPGRTMVSGLRWNTKTRSIQIRHRYGDNFVRAVLSRVDKLL